MGGPGSGRYAAGSGVKYVPHPRVKKVRVDIGYGVRIGGHVPTELNRIKEGVPKDVANRLPRTVDEIIYSWHELKDMREEAPKGINTKSVPKDPDSRQGKCFELSSQFVMDNKDWNVVHATLYPRLGQWANKIYFHSYAEKGNTIFDPVFNTFYTKDRYEKYYSITDRREYSQAQAMKSMLKSGNYGPWS